MCFECERHGRDLRYVASAEQVSTTGRLRGVIRSLPNGQYGFIGHPDFPRNLFFHRSDVLEVPFSTLAPGQSVEFSVSEGDRGPRAVDVAVI